MRSLALKLTCLLTLLPAFAVGCAAADTAAPDSYAMSDADYGYAEKAEAAPADGAYYDGEGASAGSYDYADDVVAGTRRFTLFRRQLSVRGRG